MMKWTLPIVALFLLSFKGDTTSDKLLQVVMNVFSNYHYAPSELDDAYSEKVYDLYIENVDYFKRFLTQEDLNKLEKHKLQIDDQIMTNDYSFFNLSQDLIVDRIDQAESLYKKILSKPFNYDKDVTFETDPEKRDFLSQKEFKSYWENSLQYQTMIRINELEEKEEYKEQSFDSIEKEARKNVMKRFDDVFDRMSQIERTDRKTMYVNAITNAHGPHSSYMPPKQKENFDIRMSGKLEGIGATLSQTYGEIKVVNIVPGGPAYLEGKLDVEDIIQSVQQENEKEAVDLEGMRLDDAVQLIRGKKGTVVTLGIKKVDGTSIDIAITRDEVFLEETFAKSVILDKSNKVGYINLPRFYADFARNGSPGCAEDVEKEVEKLKAAGMEALIFDLRNNTGGALNEVVDMSGLFIEDGPIVQVKDKEKKPKVYRDSDRSITYDGPMVVLVNEFSASASEIFAAAMQDYNRAIIMGSEQTFGKGTVQRFLDLDRYLKPEYRENEPFGTLKMTFQKFYRINGGATQLRGVRPDIILPDLYSHIITGERDENFAMPWDEVEPAIYQTWEKQNAYWDQIIAENQAEIDADQTFERINNQALALKDKREETAFSLSWENFESIMETRQKSNETFDDLFQIDEELTVVPFTGQLEDALQDSVKMKLMNDWHESIQKDLYIAKALDVVADMLE